MAHSAIPDFTSHLIVGKAQAGRKQGASRAQAELKQSQERLVLDDTNLCNTNR